MLINLFSGRTIFPRLTRQTLTKPIRYVSYFFKDFRTLPGKSTDDDLLSKIKGPKKISDFHGYECIGFTLNYQQCKIVRPKKNASGNPWVLRARIWGTAPQTDIALLSQGFHITYCDVGESYGNKYTVEMWDKFYTYMRTLGLSKKVAVETYSRGSFYAYAWALKNGEKISCLYADNPPLDIKSWPGGYGKGIASKQEWKTFKKMHNLRSDEEALKFSKNPLDLAADIAKLQFPILHVCGSEDEFSPLHENTIPFRDKILQHGGKIELIIKEGVGHQPHSLEDPAPIVRFIVNATKQSIA